MSENRLPGEITPTYHFSLFMHKHFANDQISQYLPNHTNLILCKVGGCRKTRPNGELTIPGVHVAIGNRSSAGDYLGVSFHRTHSQGMADALTAKTGLIRKARFDSYDFSVCLGCYGFTVLRTATKHKLKPLSLN